MWNTTDNNPFIYIFLIMLPSQSKKAPRSVVHLFTGFRRETINSLLEFRQELKLAAIVCR